MRKIIKNIFTILILLILTVNSAIPVFANDCINIPKNGICPNNNPFLSPDGNQCCKTKPNINDLKVVMNDGKLDVSGVGNGTQNTWNGFFMKYRTVIVGIAGIGALTMIVFFIINFMKLGATSGNPQARSHALSGVLWTGIATAGLGAVAIIAGFFYNAI